MSIDAPTSIQQYCEVIIIHAPIKKKSLIKRIKFNKWEGTQSKLIGPAYPMPGRPNGGETTAKMMLAGRRV